MSNNTIAISFGADTTAADGAAAKIQKNTFTIIAFVFDSKDVF